MIRSFIRNAGKGGNLPRTHISFIGFMNAGKSSLMNALTSQPTSIVDSTPGTTADTKVTLMEIHSIGPCKLIDTAGIDEIGVLGGKKLVKTMNAAKESDILCFVIDPFNFVSDNFKPFIDLAKRRDKQVTIVFNRFQVEKFEEKKEIAQKVIDELSGRHVPSTVVVATNPKESKDTLIPLLTKLKKQGKPVPLVPVKFIGKDKTLALNIPMDAETPTGRLLRPQQMMLEFGLRKFSNVACYSMDLKAARSNSVAEAQRFRNFLSIKPSLFITDSQAIDICHKLVPRDIPITTFSVIMANIQSGGKLKKFLPGIDAISKLKKGDKVLICEACNHDRILDDIGTVQIPTKLRKKFPGVEIDFAFGRSYEDKNLKDYAVVLHCGGCMISKQQMEARISDLLESGVPIANYGLALSWLASPEAMNRVLEPWK